MLNVLFVDDEPQILSGLQRALRGRKNVWDLRFAGSGPEALALLEQYRLDVIVTDFRMPGMDGAELLQRVRLAHPASVRFLLSGDFDREAGLRAVSAAHQFLSKPCETSVLIQAIERACRLGELIADDTLRRVSSAIGLLPPSPRVYASLTKVVDDPGVCLDTVIGIVKQDAALTMKLLQMANSSFFGRSQTPVSSIRHAVQSLGFDTLRRLVLVVEVLQRTEHSLPDAFPREKIQRESLLAASIAEKVVAARPVIYDVTLACMLRDIGRLALAYHVTDAYCAVLRREAEGQCLSDAELDLVGARHEEVGAYIAAMWGFPDLVVQGILHHHAPLESPFWKDAEFDDRGRTTNASLAVALAGHLATGAFPLPGDPALARWHPQWSASAEPVIRDLEPT